MDSIAKSFSDALLRLGLRMLPLPAPEIYDLIRTVRRNQSDVDKQVQEAVEALSKSSTLIDNLGKTLRQREEKLRQLQDEYSRISQLASLTAEQGEAVAKSLERVLGRTRSKERIIAFTITLLLDCCCLLWVCLLPIGSRPCHKQRNSTDCQIAHTA